MWVWADHLNKLFTVQGDHSAHRIWSIFNVRCKMGMGQESWNFYFLEANRDQTLWIWPLLILCEAGNSNVWLRIVICTFFWATSNFCDKKLPLTLFHLGARLCSPHYYSIFRTSDGPGNRQSLQIPETEIILLGDLLLTNSGENCLFVSLNLNFNKIFSRILDSLLSPFYDLHFVCCLF